MVYLSLTGPQEVISSRTIWALGEGARARIRDQKGLSHARKVILLSFWYEQVSIYKHDWHAEVYISLFRLLSADL